MYSAEQILHFADEMNALPRHYGVREPEEAHKLGIKETNVQEKEHLFYYRAQDIVACWKKITTYCVH